MVIKLDNDHVYKIETKIYFCLLCEYLYKYIALTYTFASEFCGSNWYAGMLFFCAVSSLKGENQ